MNNLVTLPVLLPLATGILLLLLHGRVRAQRLISLLSALGALGLALYLTRVVWTDGIQVVQAGGWAAPYGITLAVDLFSGMMLVLASIIELATLVFLMRDSQLEQERVFLYPVLQFQMVGINLSFVTGDLFNLFVAFEVLLMASYYLLTAGGKPGQLREGFKYLVINSVASTLFLATIALLYGVTGTLNMADAARKVAALAGEPIVTLIAISFLIVFGLKGALFPLYFWLPRSYYHAPPGIAALFAGMLTKVGIYALVRVFTLIFIHDPGFTHTLILAIAGLTMLLGVLGAISQMDVKAILSYHIISQVGYMVKGLGIYTPLALAGTVFYIAHHIIVKAALFLIAGIIVRITGTTDLKRFSGLLASHPGLGLTFLATGLSLAGIPPFSGFFSKFVLLRAGVEAGTWGIVAVSLVVSLLTLFSMIKIYSRGFWGEATGELRPIPRLAYAQVMAPVLLLLTLSVGMGLGAGRFMEFALATAEQLMRPEAYIEAVLGR
ncbi:MAG: proton-conducting transporter membrane subunit [Bacillota bacterium]|nr:MAG: Na+/H+ antiporter subunit D [Bacillota bacterium]